MITIQVGDVSINVVRKDIKNLYLKVHAPDGRVSITSPLKLDEDSIRQFALAKLTWIKKKQAKFKLQTPVIAPKYVSGEYHYYKGDRFTLNVFDHGATSKVVIRDKTNLDLYVRHHSLEEQREQVLHSWYRQQLKAELPGLIAQWEKIVGVKINDWGVKKMKTRWGTCNIQAKRIWLNLELIKKPSRCLEYVIVHELVHLLERGHGDRFQAYMNQFMPNWRIYQAELNHFPNPHSD